jgi:hypothetical protein
MRPTRRQVVQMLGALGVVQSPVGIAAAPAQVALSARDLKGSLTIQGRDLDESQTEAVRLALQRNLRQFQAVRDLDIADGVPPALIFRPRQR